MGDTAISANALARRLGVSRSKVARWIRSGELPAVNLASDSTGRPRWKVLPADLEAFLDGRRAAPTPKPRKRRTRAVSSGKDYY